MNLPVTLRLVSALASPQINCAGNEGLLIAGATPQTHFANSEGGQQIRRERICPASAGPHAWRAGCARNDAAALS